MRAGKKRAGKKMPGGMGEMKLGAFAKKPAGMKPSKMFRGKRKM